MASYLFQLGFSDGYKSDNLVDFKIFMTCAQWVSNMSTLASEYLMCPCGCQWTDDISGTYEVDPRGGHVVMMMSS
jgi:hypothetical protein